LGSQHGRFSHHALVDLATSARWFIGVAMLLVHSRHVKVVPSGKQT
jgi:hypothetical protein